MDAATLAAPPPTPNLVSLAPIFPTTLPSSCRRLSSHFTKPSRPIPAARQLAWLSLQGRFVGAEEASSFRAIGGGLGREEALAWELISPVHRVLIVAVVAAAAADSKKNREIGKLRKSVQLRDEVLLSMQQKLDNLCEQVTNVKAQSETVVNLSFSRSVDFLSSETPQSKKSKSLECGCCLCDQHPAKISSMENKPVVGVGNGDEIFKYKTIATEAEQEERRMSDLSDWAALSVASSSADFQFQSLAMEPDIHNLKRECEEKDATIKELSTYLHSSDVSGSKRISQLEEMIRRKNMIITKLRKDMIVMEQKLVHLTRIRRASFLASIPKDIKQQVPFMADNLLYDMDNSSGSSSSDSDCSDPNRAQASNSKNADISTQNGDSTSRRNQIVTIMKCEKSRPVTPLKEKSLNQRADSVPNLRPKQLVSSSGGDQKRIRRRTQSGSKDANTPHKRWV